MLKLWFPGAFATLAVLISLGLAGTANAGGLAVQGEVFATGLLDNPAGSLPGGESGYSNEPQNHDVSQDGRFISFTSHANSLATGANPDVVNIFRKDRLTGAVDLASRSTGVDGPGGRGTSVDSKISDDGNLVAFASTASLDPADVDGGQRDIYVRDFTTNTTIFATAGINGEIGQFDFSGDGQYIAFGTQASLVVNDLNGFSDIYRRNLSGGPSALVSRIQASETPVDSASSYPAISDDGRWVAFATNASNAIVGFTNGNSSGTDIYIRDMNGGAPPTNFLVSAKNTLATGGANGYSYEPEIAGKPVTASDIKVAYTSESTDAAAGGVDPDTASSVYLRSLAAVASGLISKSTANLNANSRAHSPSISDDATRIEFSTDATNLIPGAIYYGAYLRDQAAGTTTLTSNSTEYAVYGSISGNGNYAVWGERGGFTADSDPDSFGVFGRSLPDGPAEFASRPAGTAPFLKTAANVSLQSNRGHTLSADGRYLTFDGYSARLNGGDLDIQVYRRDLLTGETVLVSRRTGAAGTASPAGAEYGTISADGNLVAFVSYADLTDDDTNTKADVYVRDLKAGTTTLASRADGPTGALGDASSGNPMISADGKRVVFVSASTNFGAGGGFPQVYVRELATGTTTLVSRADGVAGLASAGGAVEGSISGDGNLVVFSSSSINLSPDDLAPDRDVYLRNLSAGTTTLLSRAPGLNGARLTDFEYGQTISTDGSTVAFETRQQDAVPGGPAWPAGESQIVIRNIASGQNTLVSEIGGVPGDDSSGEPTLNADASVIAFESRATNLLPAVGGDSYDYVAVRRMSDATLVGPPVFGDRELSTAVGTYDPSLSDNGQCLSFNARGHNDISGEASDIRTSYLQVLSGTCFNPRAITPVLTSVSLKPKKFAVSKKPTAKAAATASAKGKKKPKKSPKGTKIRFTLNRDANVTFTIERKTIGRKVKGKCVKSSRKLRRKKKCVRWVPAGKLVRNSQAAGNRVLAFTGRVGKKKLKPGVYRVGLQATASTGTSAVVRKSFVVLRK